MGCGTICPRRRCGGAGCALSGLGPFRLSGAGAENRAGRLWRVPGLLVLVTATLFSLSQPSLAQFSQQGPKLVGTEAVGGAHPAYQGWSVSLSSDGDTAVVGGPTADGGTGATWVYTRSGGVWAQQTMLVDANAIGARQGTSVSLSSDGNTAIVGGPSDNGGIGAAWLYTRSGGVWAQQKKLVDANAIGAHQGTSVALSADGSKAIVGGPYEGGSNQKMGTGAA